MKAWTYICGLGNLRVLNQGFCSQYLIPHRDGSEVEPTTPLHEVIGQPTQLLEHLKLYLLILHCLETFLFHPPLLFFVTASTQLIQVSSTLQLQVLSALDSPISFFITCPEDLQHTPLLLLSLKPTHCSYYVIQALTYLSVACILFFLDFPLTTSNTLSLITLLISPLFYKGFLLQ